MAQPESATTIKQWMEQFAAAALDGRVEETSAGAGPHHDFAYLHYRTSDGGHYALVVRATMVDGQPELRLVEVDGDVEQIRDRVDAAPHGQAALQ
jgi:hypothetical protein